MAPSLPGLLATLRGQLRPRQDAPLISSGAAALDRLLPDGGLRAGSLVEYLAEGAGHGAKSLALAAARAACRDGRRLVVVDRLRQFYPPAAAAVGMDLTQMVVLRPANAVDELWAIDQALRCGGVGAVWFARESISPRDFRRLQLAAESGQTLGLLLRSARLRGQPTWADVQWLIQPQPSRERWKIRVELLRCRGGTGGRSVLLDLDEATSTWQEANDSHETHPLHPSAELADSTTARQRSLA